MVDLAEMLSVLPDVAEAAVLRPGDTLVLRVSLLSGVTDADFKLAADLATGEIEGQLPGVKVLFIAADGMVVYRPDAWPTVEDR